MTTRTEGEMGWVRRAAVLVVVTAVGLVACGGDDDATTDTTLAESQAEQVSGEVQVFAAASLTNAFEEIGEAFEADNPDAGVTFNFAASSALAQQVVDGAPADVLATADQRTMDEAVESGSELFARNHLVLVVPAGNPGGVTGLADLADADLYIGLCAAEVPCGTLAAGFLEDEGVAPAVDSYEPDVRALLTKLTAGELDAGLVYRTDVIGAGDDVEVIEVDGIDAAATTYPVAALDTGGNADAGRAFVDFVLGEKAQAILADHGFAPPP